AKRGRVIGRFRTPERRIALNGSTLALRRLGWSDELEEAFAPFAAQGSVPGRVAVQHRGAYGVYTEAGEASAELPGRLLHEAAGADDLPAAGDWVALELPAGAERGLVRAVLPRRTKLSRRAAFSESDEQIIGANVDVVLVLQSLAGDFNLRRLE